MKAPLPPVFAIQSFPQAPDPRRPYYAERLATHIRRFPHVAAPHAHDFYLLLYVTHGWGRHTIDLITYDVRPGSLFFMTPGQMHSWQLPEAEGFVLFFEPAFFLQRYPGDRLYQYPFFSPDQPPVLYLAPAEADILPLFERVVTEAATPHPHQADVVGAYLYVCLELAARHYPAAPAPAEALLGQQQIRAFGHLLNEHFRARRTVQFYADRLSLTPNHLNAVCRRLLNKTASTLIQERVISEAQRLLTHSAQSVAQVADALGFADASYFGRYFRKATGHTPEAYRHQR